MSIDREMLPIIITQISAEFESLNLTVVKITAYAILRKLFQILHAEHTTNLLCFFVIGFFPSLVSCHVALVAQLQKEALF